MSFWGELLKLIQVGTSLAELHLAADLAFLVFLLDKEKLNHPTAFPQNNFCNPALVALTREDRLTFVCSQDYCKPSI